MECRGIMPLFLIKIRSNYDKTKPICYSERIIKKLKKMTAKKVIFFIVLLAAFLGIM